jgi:lysophospholipase L1-like esterase
MWITLLALVALCLSGAVSAQPLSPAPQFQDGDKVVLVGDSITHGRKWHRYVYAYYLTRFPQRRIRFINQGIAGDSAGGALRRLDWDILPHQPNAATIFLGMNDVGRGHYGPADPTEKILQARQTALDNYRRNMDSLADQLQAAGVQKLWFMTPSPYDDTAQLAAENFVGVNGALAQCGRYGTELAAKYGGGLIDLNTPMTALNQKHQQADPAFTLIGPDRVHPGDLGMMVIAYYTLRAQGCGPLVSRVVVDAAAGGRVVEALQAEVTGLRVTPESIEFTCRESALPWPLEPSARGALTLVPLVEDLNQQQLVVQLPAGTYALSLDDREVGRYTAAQLQAGINLATNEATPQYQQALRVWQINEQRSNLEVSLRTHAQMRTVLRGKAVNEDDPEAVEACFNEFLARVGESMRPYFTNQINVYRKTRSELESISARMEALQQELWQLNQPQPHHYRLALVP